MGSRFWPRLATWYQPFLRSIRKGRAMRKANYRKGARVKYKCYKSRRDPPDTKCAKQTTGKVQGSRINVTSQDETPLIQCAKQTTGKVQGSSINVTSQDVTPLIQVKT